MKLTFHGGAKMVTGSCYLVESAGVKILVDCGLYQGSRFCERLNFEPFAFDPKEIAAVFVTHSHIDHIGRLPQLVKAGFRGVVYSTEPARDFAELLLLDSMHILVDEAARFKKPPLYHLEDLDLLMRQWKGVPYHQPVEIGPFRVTFSDAGHILGSSFVALEAEGKITLFSGDLGNSPAPIIGNREDYPEHAAYCLIESVYGDRVHESPELRHELLEDAIEETVRQGGVLMIPAFAMERTQDLLFELNNLAEQGKIPKAPIFLDSPLAIKITGVYKKYERYFNPAARRLIASGDEIFQFPRLKMTLTTEESKAINAVPPPKIIIAGAGMSNGGRILHHEKRYLPDAKNTLLFIGYQAAGSLGRQILEGASAVTIHGEEVFIRARSKEISGYSAHADQTQLLDWLRPQRDSLQRVFTVQGEPKASEQLAQKIRDELAVEAVIPSLGDTVEL